MNISALDETGKTVDWWFIYKVPQLNAGQGSDAATGYEYVYYDSEMDKDKKPVIKSLNVLNKDKGALNNTLDSVFKNYPKAPSPTTGWILYNDEMPSSVGKHDDGNKGHTKGVLAFDTATKTGYWLLHSWPKFTDPHATTDPTPKYGQTYLCITLDLATVSKIAAQMIDHQEPQVYYTNTVNLPATDAICLLAKGQNPAPKGDSNAIQLKSKGGMAFQVIAKNREWDKDFWNGLVGPTLKDDMDVETWIRGPIPPIADTDGIHKTFDIKYINLGAMGAHWAWPETHDHAKWGITKNEPWVCVGDINRMISQRKRGGGTIAFQNKILWLGLSKSGLVLAPPGTSRAEAHDMIKETHDAKSQAPPKANVKHAAKTKPAAKAKPVKKAKPAAKAKKKKK